MRRRSDRLTLWLQTGYRKGNFFRLIFRILSSPIFLIIISVIAVVGIIYFSNLWWVGASASTAGLAVLIIIIRKRAKGKLIISKRKANKFNNFAYALNWTGNVCRQRVDLTERTREDKTASNLLYRHLGEALVTLDMYDETGQIKIDVLTGNEYTRIKLADFHVDFTLKSGFGYILFQPSLTLISKAKLVDEKVISLILREIGLLNWSVERANYNDVILFILKNEAVSCAFNFKNIDMYEKLKTLARTAEDYEIPIQKNLNWSLRSAPGALISANTGFGKSFFAFYLIIMASIKNNILFLADPKRSDLASLSEFMPPERVVWEADKISEMVENVVEIMMLRYDYMKTERLRKSLFQADFVDFGLPVILLVIEEMAAFVSSLDKRARESFEANIKSITLQGRQAGVILCSIMQNPGTQNISTESRSQLSFRVYLGNSGGIEYRMIFGDGYTYPKRVFNPGQGLYMLAGRTEQPDMIETPILDKSQLSETLRLALKSQFDVNLLPLRSQSETL